MSRAIENYICASEDRPHFNNDFFIDYDYWSFPLIPFYYPNEICPYEEYYQPQQQNPTSVVINETIIQQSITQEEITELLNRTIPQLAENLAERLGNIISEEDLDAAINEIYGGSASDMIGGIVEP